MSDGLASGGYTQPHSYGDIPVLPTIFWIMFLKGSKLKFQLHLNV
jgi:hypothetical protein